MIEIDWVGGGEGGGGRGSERERERVSLIDRFIELNIDNELMMRL